MLRARLKEIDMRITELADYLQVSRPTMYKFIDCYDANDFDLINKKVLKLFNYIMENELAGKKNVINYILNNLVELKELGSDDEQSSIKNVKRFISTNPESKKCQFIDICTKSQVFDELIFYLVDIFPLTKKRNLTDDESELLQSYQKIKEIIPKSTKKGEK